MTTHRNKRWTLRNGNQVLRDVTQAAVAVVYPDHLMVFRGVCHWYSSQEAARDAAEKMALEAGYRLSPVGLPGEVEGE